MRRIFTDCYLFYQTRENRSNPCHPCSIPGRPPAGGQRLFVPGVGVALHHGAAQGADALKHLARMRPQGDQIAQADEVVYVTAFDVGQHRVQRGQVAVDVREGRDAHGTSP